MAAAAVLSPPHDHVDDWLDELVRVRELAAALSPEARRAVASVLESFAVEDGFERPLAASLRRELGPFRDAGEPPLVAALLSGLRSAAS